MKTVIVISKDDCSLCEKALEVLYALQKEIPFSIEVRKIVPDTDVYERYMEKIPVIFIDETEISHYRVNIPKLKKKLNDRR
jgi:glutaredoxin